MKHLFYVTFGLLSYSSVAQVQINDPLMDQQQIQAYGPGSYLLVPYKVAHYEGAQGNTIIIGTGVGPWCTYEHPQ